MKVFNVLLILVCVIATCGILNHWRIQKVDTDKAKELASLETVKPN